MMVKTFTDLVLTAITDTIPNKLITCNSNDPPWIAPGIKKQSGGNIEFTKSMSQEAAKLMN